MDERRNATRAIVVAAMIYPTVLTLAYFRWLDDAGPFLQRGVFQGGKLIQFLLPLVWVWWVLKQKPKWTLPRRRELLENLAFGAVVLVAILLLYHLLLPLLDLLLHLLRRFTTALLLALLHLLLLHLLLLHLTHLLHFLLL